jgi:hypothetical protein
MFATGRLVTDSAWCIPYGSVAPESVSDIRSAYGIAHRNATDESGTSSSDDTATLSDAFSERRVVRLGARREHIKARFRMLRRLRDNHDGEGARAAQQMSVDYAIAFIGRHTFELPALATLNDEGLAVIEFHGTQKDVFAEITFSPDNQIECYWKADNLPSQMCAGKPDDPVVVEFLARFAVS